MITLLWGFALIFILCGYAVSVFFSLNVNRLLNDIQSVNDLKNVRVGVIEKSSSYQYLNALDIKPLLFKDFPSLFDALDKDEVQVVVHDEPILRYYIAQNQLEAKVQILPLKFNKQYYSFSIPMNSPLLRPVNISLFKMIENNITDEILQKYNLQE